MDLFRGSTHDFVDNGYWSAMQISVKRLATQHMMDIRSEDFGKVLLFATMTLDKKLLAESEA